MLELLSHEITLSDAHGQRLEDSFTELVRSSSVLSGDNAETTPNLKKSRPISLPALEIHGLCTAFHQQSPPLESWRREGSFRLNREISRGDSVSSPPVLSLNDEVFGNIFSHLDWVDLVRWSGASTSTRRLVENLDESNMLLHVGKLQKVFSLLLARLRYFSAGHWESEKVHPVDQVTSSDLKIFYPQFCAKLVSRRNDESFDLLVALNTEQARIRAGMRWMLAMWRQAYRRRLAFQHCSGADLLAPSA